MNGWRVFERIFGVEKAKNEMCIYLNFLPFFARLLEFHLNLPRKHS
jgi:hypothetical protein